jgi:hypothetical protein
MFVCGRGRVCLGRLLGEIACLVCRWLVDTKICLGGGAGRQLEHVKLRT